MNKPRRGFLPLAVFALLGMASALAGAFGDLTLTVEPLAARLAVGEPVVVRVAAANGGRTPVDAPADLGVGYGLLHILIAPPGGDFARFRGSRWGVSGARPSSASWVPGSELAANLTLFYQEPIPGHENLYAPAFPFAKPGRYRIVAVWHDRDFGRQLRSAPAEVEVVAATGPDAHVWQALAADRELALAVQDGFVPPGTDLHRRLRALLAAHPDARKAAEKLKPLLASNG